MHGRRIVTLIVATVALCGCATSYAPDGILFEPDESLSSPYGAWVHIEHTGQPERPAPSYPGRPYPRTTEGELIAVGADSFYVVSYVGLVAISQSDITLAQAELYDASLGTIGVMTLLGTLSTISHGFVLILSAPAWIIAGTVSGAAQSREPILKYPDEPINRFAELARFPLGLPADIDRARLASGYRITEQKR